VIFNWDSAKNNLLKNTRNISFEEIVNAINEGKLVDAIDNPQKEKYKGQVYLMVEINNYIYVVPAAISQEDVFLKTIYPGRKYTEKYLEGSDEKEHQS
jgi:uncharacterized DUF497 family protein